MFSSCNQPRSGLVCTSEPVFEFALFDCEHLPTALLSECSICRALGVSKKLAVRLGNLYEGLCLVFSAPLFRRCLIFVPFSKVEDARHLGRSDQLRKPLS